MRPVPYHDPTVDRLLSRSRHVDGHPPLSEHKLESIGRAGARSGAWADEGGVYAVAVAAYHDAGGHWAVEVAVEPDRRESRVEEAAIRAAAQLVPDGARHTLWSFRPRQVHAAARLGYRTVRAIVRMAGPIPPRTAGAPQGVSLTHATDADTAAIVDINNRAFEGHPEQGAMTPMGFRALADRAWFDPAGVIVARSGSRITGFCVTKLEGRSSGEIYLIAVDPDAQGRAIGRSLLQAGAGHLRARGAREMSLWVDAANESAIGLYGSIGLVEGFRTNELAQLSDL